MQLSCTHIAVPLPPKSKTNTLCHIIISNMNVAQKSINMNIIFMNIFMSTIMSTIMNIIMSITTNTTTSMGD